MTQNTLMRRQAFLIDCIDSVNSASSLRSLMMFLSSFSGGSWETYEITVIIPEDWNEIQLCLDSSGRNDYLLFYLIGDIKIQKNGEAAVSFCKKHHQIAQLNFPGDRNVIILENGAEAMQDLDRLEFATPGSEEGRKFFEKVLQKSDFGTILLHADRAASGGSSLFRAMLVGINHWQRSNSPLKTLNFELVSQMTALYKSCHLDKKYSFRRKPKLPPFALRSEVRTHS